MAQFVNGQCMGVAKTFTTKTAFVFLFARMTYHMYPQRIWIAEGIRAQLANVRPLPSVQIQMSFVISDLAKFFLAIFTLVPFYLTVH